MRLQLGGAINKRAFGELESQILYIMRSGERQTVKEVHKALGGNDNYNTVMTVMSRLAEKKVLSREKMGLQYGYWLLKNTPATMVLEKVKNKLLGIKRSQLVCHLIESAEDITEEELSEIEQMIVARRSKK